MEGETTVYDKAEWHYESDWPKGLSKRQACVHIGWMLGWLVDQDLISDEFKDDFAKDIERFRQRRITGPRLLEISGKVLFSNMVIQEASEFLREYYGDEVPGVSYFLDHEKLLKPGLPTSYHARDTWENFKRMSRRIQKRYKAWSKKPWGKRLARKPKPEIWTCAKCNRVISRSVDDLTGGLCKNCFTLPEPKEARKMERLLDRDRPAKSVLDAVRFHIPSGSTPKAALRSIRRFHKWYKPLFAFFKKKGLMEASPIWMSGYWNELLRSDFTDLGFRLFKRCKLKWQENLEAGQNPKNLRIWIRELSRMKRRK